ncbi:MAG TPA: MATE family efflux transporter [Caldithrix abyssi]|uniref:Multidrug-efflux transporter n=1 Tax=Caldithrix abyssi TaxID=187145 RepID=A0A7V5UE36_CALAY|nr:MATE family efflux transporter [Caldithrix abyssi]
MDLTSLEKKGTLKEVLRTSLPAVIDLSSQTITWLIEAIFIGQLSAYALAGVGIAQQFVILTFSVLLTFVVGSSIIIVRYLGAGDKWNANHVLGQALFMGIILSIVIALVWYFVVPLLFYLIKEEGSQARYYGVIYIKTISYFAPLIITNFIAIGILRGVGDTLLTMTISLIINGLNILLDVLLIFGVAGFPRLETLGAALGVGIAHTVGFIITLIFLRNRKSSLFLAVMEITRPRLATFKQLFKLGIPTTVEQFVWSVGQLILSFFAARIGVTILAAHQVLVRLQSVISMINWGFAVSAMTLVGKNIGANDYVEARKSGKVVALVSMLTSGVLMVVLYFLSTPILSVFTNDLNVVRAGQAIIIAFIILQIPKAANTSYSGGLRGAADLNWLMYLAIGSVILNEFLGAYVLCFGIGLGLLGLWIIQIFDESGRLILNVWRFNRGHWKDIF